MAIPEGIARERFGFEPYTNGPGSVAVATSQDRENTLVDTGLSYTMREIVLGILYERGSYGITGKELRNLSSAPPRLREYANGTSMLTGLYILSKCAKLDVRRDGGFVYVHNDFVHGRSTQHYIPAHLRRFTPEERKLAELLMATIGSDPAPSPNRATMLSLLRKVFREES